MIDYTNIQYALDWYAKRGTFKQIDVPWLVSREALDVTSPSSAQLLETPLGCLVASGEQSFIQMMMDGSLKPGNYCCVTPCFRDEPVVDELHRTSFLKVELISAWPDIEGQALRNMLHAAFYMHLNVMRARTVRTDDGYDIMCQGIELGSYGIRQHGDLRWVYGTGIAEPRFTQAYLKDQEKKAEHRERIKSPEFKEPIKSKEGLHVQQSSCSPG